MPRAYGRLLFLQDGNSEGFFTPSFQSSDRFVDIGSRLLFGFSSVLRLLQHDLAACVLYSPRP
jgi:hypothetical protein